MGDFLKTLLLMFLWEKGDEAADRNRKLTNLLVCLLLAIAVTFGWQLNERLDRLERNQMAIQQEYYRIAVIEQIVKGIDVRLERVERWLSGDLRQP